LDLGIIHIKQQRLAIFIAFILFTISIIIGSVEGARDYDPSHWSDEIQITDDYGTIHQYKSVLGVQELSNGGFNLMYETTDGEERQNIGTIHTDKLGGSIEEWNASLPIPPFGFYHWYTTDRQWAYHFDEDRNVVQLILIPSRSRIEFYEFLPDGEMILEEELLLSELMEYDGSCGFFDRVEATWDKFGSAHCIISYEDWDRNNNIIKSITQLYMRVTWRPFRLSVETVDQSPVFEDVFLGTTPIGQIDVSDHGYVAIVYSGLKGNEYIRFLTIKSPNGNWTTVWIAVSNTILEGPFTPFSGIMIDEDLNIHIGWAETIAILYCKVSIVGTILNGPVILTYLPVDNYNEIIDVTFQITSDNDLLIVYNSNPYTAPFLHVNKPSAEIHIIIVPDCDLNSHERADFLLVAVPSATEAVLYMDEEENLFLFWFDQRTGITEIYMRYLAIPGISIAFDPTLWSVIQYIRPDETKTVPLGVKNYGSVEVDTRLRLETTADWTWHLWLDRYSAHVEAGEVVPFNLTVHCPSDAQHWDTIVLWVNVTTTDEEYKASFRLTMHVVWDRGISVHKDRSYHIVDPGDTISFHLSVLNIGELPEDIAVRIRYIGSDRWQFDPIEANLSLDPDEVGHMFINVTAPLDSVADDTLVLVLEFYYADGNRAHENVVLRTVVRPTFFVTMTINRTEAVVAPGTDERFRITVGNKGNLGGTAYVEVSILTDPGDWVVVLETESVFLRSNERAAMDLTICAPHDARGGDLLVVRVRAYCPKPFSEVTREVVAQVEEVHGLRWTRDSIRWDLYPDGERYHKFTIHNDGNVFETVTFSTDLYRPGWLTRVEQDGTIIDRLRIGPEEQETVSIFMRVSPDARSGMNSFHIYIDREGTTVGTVDLQVYVRQVHKMDVRVNVIGPAVIPGGTLKALITVKNLGNGPDTFRIDTSGSGISEVTFFTDETDTDTIWVPRDSTVELQMIALAGVDLLRGTNTFKVTVTSLIDASESMTITVDITVIWPELRIVSVVTAPSTPMPNEVVTVKVHLENPGPVELVDVAVTLEGRGTEHIASIAPEGTATAVFTWIAPEESKATLRGTVSYGPGSYQKVWRHDVDIEEVETNAILFWFPILAIVFGVFTIALVVSRGPTPPVTNGN